MTDTDTKTEELSAAELADFDDTAAGQEETAAAMAPAKDDAPAADDLPPAVVDDASAASVEVTDDAGDDKSKQPTIPKSRFDEAIAKERERADARAAELQAQIEALKAGPAVNYGEEIASVTEAIKELRADWNNDKFDGSFEEYEAKQTELQDKRESLLVGKVKADAKAEFQEEQDQRTKQERLASWDKDAAAFVSKNDRYKDAEELARFNEELEMQFIRNPAGSNSDWLAEADKRVKALAIVEGREVQEASSATNVTNLHAARNAADAKAQAVASTAPNPAGAGAGDRGRASFPGIGPDMSDDDYKKLPKDLRESKDVAGF